MSMLADIVAALRERTWLSPVSAEEMNHRDRWLADQIEAALAPSPIETPADQPGLKLTLENDFLAIGQLLDSTRNGYDLVLRRGYQLRDAIGRFFGDDKLCMFDHDGLIRFIDQQKALRDAEQSAALPSVREPLDELQQIVSGFMDDGSPSGPDCHRMVSRAQIAALAIRIWRAALRQGEAEKS